MIIRTTTSRLLLELEDSFKGLGNNGVGINKERSKERTEALREIVLARALYRCGDYNGLGESILENYQKDMHTYDLQQTRRSWLTC